MPKEITSATATVRAEFTLLIDIGLARDEAETQLDALNSELQKLALHRVSAKFREGEEKPHFDDIRIYDMDIVAEPISLDSAK